MNSNDFLQLIQNLKAEIWFKIIASTLLAFLAAIAAMMANRHIAVYNDASRPLVGEAKKGNMKFKALAISNFGLSIGFVIGFIPQSAALAMIILHTILLMSDIIGISLPKKGWANIVAPILGLAWGYGLYWGLEGIQWVFDNVTYPNFGMELGKIGDVYNALFVIFPAIVIGYQFGWVHGLWSAIVIFATYIVITIWGVKVKLSALAIGLLVGVLLMIFIAIAKNSINNKKAKIEAKPESEVESAKNMILDFFENNAKKIKTHKWWFLITGTLVSMCVSLFTLQTPQAISFWAAGDITSVAIIESVKTFSFIPLISVTSLATGVYSPSGLTFSSVMGVVGSIIGFEIAKSTGNIETYLVGTLIGGILGGAIQFGEVYALTGIAKWLDKNPLMRSMGDGIRTTISNILSTSLLIGGVMASFIMGNTVSAATGIAGLAPIGILLVLGIYLLNKTFKKPIPEIAIGPVMTIVFGIILNVIYFIA